MNNGWKALVGVAAAAALVLAPLVATAATADELAPDDQVVAEAIAPAPSPEAAAEEVAPAPSPEATAEEVAPDDQVAAEATAPAPSPEAAAEEVAAEEAAPEEVAPDDQVVAEAIAPAAAPSEDPERKVFVCKYVGTPGVNERADHVNSVSVSTLDGWDGSTFPFVFADGQNNSVAIAFDTGDEPPSIGACPPSAYLVPAAFNAAPTPASCDTGGAFSLAFLGDPEWTEGAYSGYEFENVSVFVDRSIAGQINLTITAHEGFILSGLSDAWAVSEARTSAQRSIVIGEATGYQSTDPEEPCFLAELTEVALAAPIVNDECGTANDFGALPETEGVVYTWEDESDDSNFNVIATVEEGYVVTSAAEGWMEYEDGTLVYPWTYEFTDEPCPTPTPEPTPEPEPTPAPAGTPAPVPALAATGGDMGPLLPMGAAILAMTGLALLVSRRLIKH